jgi:hypothetical protein
MEIEVPPGDITIHLGRQTRTLEVNYRSMRIASRLLGGKSPRNELALNGDVDVVLCCAAAALHKSMGDKVDANRVGKWVDAEPRKYLELKAKVAEAFRRYYVAIGELEEDEGRPPGEAEGSQQSPATTSKP